MPFWSGEKLALRLPTLILPFRPDRIDCAAYTLSVGQDVYITEDARPTGEPRKGIKFSLDSKGAFRIPPGQFAFLTTEESVEVPNDALAFISMKATYKFRGLVNVSGFHVDPGWKGPLVFSVYNAGPAPVHLSRGLPLFLIWYSDLDQSSQKTYKPDPSKVGLRDELISNMSGQVFSPMNLSEHLDRLREEQMQLKTNLESHKKLTYGVGGAFLTVFLGLIGAVFGLLGEPFRDFLVKEYAEHQIKTKDCCAEDQKGSARPTSDFKAPSSPTPPEPNKQRPVDGSGSTSTPTPTTSLAPQSMKGVDLNRASTKKDPQNTLAPSTEQKVRLPKNDTSEK